ncbi:uncharacterized protein LOC134935734 [Pseudophryne corroboree]|uniref:uncharacterized protein LOC134935734 n=1 Tax=Pseudophryne corroboree TaxID=495146 RepID=UPI00308146B1
MRIKPNIWSFDSYFTFFILVFLILDSTCIVYEKKYLPLGADITIECKSPTPGEPSFSGSFVRRKNTHEFIYLDAVYMQIRDFSQNNRGTYRCISGDNIVSVTSLELSEKPATEDIVKLRSVGDELLMHCRRLTRATHVQWDWIPYDSGRTVSINVENEKIISDNNFESRLEISSDLTMKLSPVRFRDAGTYQCLFSDQTIGTSYTLITIQLSASPSSEVVRGSNVSLTCSLPHLSPMKYNSLVWAKMTETGLVPVKTQILNITMKENIVFIKDVSEEDLHWTCLVFHHSELAAFIQLQLLYRGTPAELATNIYQTSAAYTRIIKGAAENENILRNSVFYARNICLVPAFAVTLLIIYRIFK